LYSDNKIAPLVPVLFRPYLTSSIGKGNFLVTFGFNNKSVNDHWGQGMGYRNTFLFLLRGSLLVLFATTASAQMPGTVTECDYGNVVDTFEICNNVNDSCYTVSVVTDTFSYCTTTSLPSDLGYQTGPGGGGGGGSSSSSTDQDGDGKTDCWKNITTNSGAPISSGFGVRTINGVTDNHTGTDIAVANGTGVAATGAGSVVETEDTNAIGQGTGNGNFIRIDYDNGTQGVYLHLDNVNVSTGSRVSQGQLIGTSNNTGSSSGPHLHYAIWKTHGHTGSADDFNNFHDPEVEHANCSASGTTTP